jgi:hypothetical protein
LREILVQSTKERLLLKIPQVLLSMSKKRRQKSSQKLRQQNLILLLFGYQAFGNGVAKNTHGSMDIGIQIRKAKNGFRENGKKPVMVGSGNRDIGVNHEFHEHKKMIRKIRVALRCSVSRDREIRD